MTWVHLLLVGAAGLAAGAINSIAGSGSLITFPTLLAVGLPPLQANVSNSIGLVPGSISGAYGYRSELRGRLGHALRLSIPMGAGAAVGAVLLLRLPPRVFEVAVPLLVAAASVLVLAQPAISRALRAERDHPAALRVSLLVLGVYAGYFGAAQGIMLLAVMGLFLDESLQRANAFKTVIAGAAACVAGLIFIVVAPVPWPYTAVLAASSLVGGRLGAMIARRVPDRPLRWGIGVFGIVVAARLALTYHLF